MRKLLASLAVPAVAALGVGVADAAPGNVGAQGSNAIESARTSGDVVQVHWRHGHKHKWHRHHYGHYRPYHYYYPRPYYPRRYYYPSYYYGPYYYRPYYHRRPRFSLHIGF